MEEILKHLGTAAEGLKLARLLYEQAVNAKQDFSEDDQAKLKARLKEVQLEYDTVHEATQKKLRG